MLDTSPVSSLRLTVRLEFEGLGIGGEWGSWCEFIWGLQDWWLCSSSSPSARFDGHGLLFLEVVVVSLLQVYIGLF